MRENCDGTTNRNARCRNAAKLTIDKSAWVSELHLCHLHARKFSADWQTWRNAHIAGGE